MDIRPGDVFDSRAITPFAQLAEFSNNGTARGWMIEGAIREDDFQAHLVLAQLGCPQPKNPHSDIDRPKHHFFDIQRGGAGIPLVAGISAPDWALGREGRGPASSQNQFSLPDARVYQLRSLTESSRVERDRNAARDRKSTRLNSSHGYISYAVFCLKKKKNNAIAESMHALYPL